MSVEHSGLRSFQPPIQPAIGGDQRRPVELLANQPGQNGNLGARCRRDKHYVKKSMGSIRRQEVMNGGCGPSTAVSVPDSGDRLGGIDRRR